VKTIIFAPLLALACFGQAAPVFTVSTGTTCSADLTPDQVQIDCAHQGKPVMSATLRLAPLLGNARGAVIGFNAQDNVTMLFKRQAAGDPLRIEVAVNDQMVIEQDVPVPAQ
jgi:hypothetical protein